MVWPFADGSSPGFCKDGLELYEQIKGMTFSKFLNTWVRTTKNYTAWIAFPCLAILGLWILIAIDYARFKKKLQQAEAAHRHPATPLKASDEGACDPTAPGSPSSDCRGDAPASQHPRKRVAKEQEAHTTTLMEKAETLLTLPEAGPLPSHPAEASDFGEADAAMRLQRSYSWTCRLEPGSYRRVALLAGCSTAPMALYQLGHLQPARLLALLGAAAAAQPHLFKCSKYRADHTLRCTLAHEDKRRPFTDKLVWTSLVYAIPAIYGLYAHQYGIAVLQGLTSCGSTMFHLARETRYFNLDNIFAQSLLFTTAWAVLMAVFYGHWYYVLMMIAAGPPAIYFIVACGMPGVVCCHPTKGNGQLQRKSNPDYDFYHMLWHLCSGFTTLLSIHYFEVEFPDLDTGAGWVMGFPEVPIVPTIALTLSALINCYGNWRGIMPLA